ncbi:hypothetical protein H7J07_07850 [Mycobacterium koreense]|uniref:Uncharacterized protein n=1 Tax=Mycolicibacillus koreensis TaxID=1069220 RepID=A0A7I7SGE3_9MYCO|nr:hypothetical protein [Mycolicibacillus koreensis]MCV7248130.1 hypothetical protein [Mycolicibacillus koreensis]OSC35754.1 hypothetical protein B8W67_01385 [Mycolicibacillus koreensis]BBY55065.1 hypothetical protein MKOR_23160 [Mycolicibacillus koreensis]
MIVTRWLDDRWYDLTHAGPVTWLAIAVWLTLVLALLALLFVLSQLRKARQLRAEESRPAAAMFMEPHPTDWHLIELVVRNFGQRTAYDIGFSFTSPPTVAAYENAADGFADVVELDLPERLPSLAPGQEWRLVWDSARDRAQIGSQIESVFTGTLTYYDRPADGGGRWWRGRRSRRTPLRSEILLDWTALPPTQRIELMTTHDLARREKQKLELLRGVLSYFHYAAKENRPEVLREEIDRIEHAARDVQERWRDQQAPPAPQGPPPPQQGVDPDATVRLDTAAAGRHRGLPETPPRPRNGDDPR